MRVCMIMAGPLPPREGIGFYVWNLARFLVREGHEVQIITRGAARRTTSEVQEGVTIWRPPFVPTYPLHVHLHGVFVERLVRAIDPSVDLYHIHTPLPPVITTSKPVMVTFHSAVRHDVRATRLNSIYTAQMKLQAPVSYMLERALLRRADAVSVVSPQVARALATYPGCPADVRVTWNGVDTSVFRPGDAAAREPRTVLTVGRLAPGKGMEEFVEVAALVNRRLGPTRFLIVGEGMLRQPLEALIAQRQLAGQIELLGHMQDRTQLAALYRRASAFALLSHHEGLPTVVLEAMACGCPVVATSVGGIPSIIEDGLSGLLVPPRDPQRAADALCRLLQDAELRSGFGEQAAHTAERRFSWDVIGQGYLAEYESLLRGQRTLVG